MLFTASGYQNDPLVGLLVGVDVGGLVGGDVGGFVGGVVGFCVAVVVVVVDVVCVGAGGVNIGHAISSHVYSQQHSALELNK